MLTSYRRVAGRDFAAELDQTIADMKTGNYENALLRFETRIGSPMLSDVVCFWFFAWQPCLSGSQMPFAARASYCFPSVALAEDSTGDYKAVRLIYLPLKWSQCMFIAGSILAFYKNSIKYSLYWANLFFCRVCTGIKIGEPSASIAIRIPSQGIRFPWTALTAAPL